MILFSAERNGVLEASLEFTGCSSKLTVEASGQAVDICSRQTYLDSQCRFDWEQAAHHGPPSALSSILGKDG